MFACVVILIFGWTNCQLLDNDPVEVAASNRRIDPNEPQYIRIRTCNAYRLFALDNVTSYDHFSNERCGRRVTHLIVQRSIIAYIPSNFFIYRTSFENLTTLRMNEVSLRAIFPQNFENISKLETLSLERNQIEYIPAAVFQHLPQLKDVSLAENRIQTIDRDAFRFCGELRNLRLNQNRLTTIDNNWFADVAKLEFLDLSDNRIDGVIDGHAFRNQQHLRLQARRNQIKSMIQLENHFDEIDVRNNELEPFPIIVSNRTRIIY